VPAASAWPRIRSRSNVTGAFLVAHAASAANSILIWSPGERMSAVAIQ
jgi:hypothetical protein